MTSAPVLPPVLVEVEVPLPEEELPEDTLLVAAGVEGLEGAEGAEGALGAVPPPLPDAAKATPGIVTARSVAMTMATISRTAIFFPDIVTLPFEYFEGSMMLQFN